MKFSLIAFIVMLCLTSLVFALEPYQGAELPVDEDRCGGPLVISLRNSDPRGLLNDATGAYGLKASLERISLSNIMRWKKELGTLNAKEQALFDLVTKSLNIPVVHRTTVDTAIFLMSNNYSLVSPYKRDTKSRITPSLEHELFGGFDCIFSAVALPYGISNYGPVIMKFKNEEGFSWGTVFTGYTYLTEILKSTSVTDKIKKSFSSYVVTNNHYKEALVLQILHHVRKGSSIRNLGVAYDKSKIIDQLLGEKNEDLFWRKVVTHRLGFLEAHHTDDIDFSDMEYVQFRDMDRPEVQKAGLPAGNFIQFFPRSK